MAMILKDRYRLVTLRCWVGFVDDPSRRSGDRKSYSPELVLRSQLYRGSETIGEQQDTPFDRLGLTRAGGYGRKGATPDLNGTPIGDQLRQAAGMVELVIWLHIPQDSFQLALLPWEEMVGHVVPCSLLRIANFLEEAYKPSPHPTVAICASQPSADGRYPVVDYVMALLASLDQAAGQASVRPAVHIFADQWWVAEIGRLALAGNGGFANLDIADVPTPPAGPSPGTVKGHRDTDPWLQWMEDHFKGSIVDVVHFISPGYYDGRSGAVALAERPDLDSDEGDFIDAPALAAFYDRLGCSVMAFSSPDMTQWEWGQRMLAFELSWIRPGPILVFEHDHTKYRAMTGNYALLFGAGSDGLHQELETYLRPHLTCHPNLLEPAHFGPLDFQQATMTSLASKRIDLAMAQLAPRGRSLSMTEQWEAKGAQEALKFLSSVVKI